MHIFSAIIDNDVPDDREVLRDWDFPCFPSIHRTVDSQSGCLETSVTMVCCATFGYNANSSKNRVTCGWSKFHMEPTLFKKNKPQDDDEAQLALLASRKLVLAAIRTREDGSPGL